MTICITMSRAAPVCVLMLLLLAAPANGQSRENSPDRRVTTANFAQAADWTAEKQLARITGLWTEPHWLPGEDRFIYKRSTGDAVQYFLVDAAAAITEPVPEKTVLDELERLSSTETSPGERISPDGKQRAHMRGYDLWIDRTDGQSEAAIRVTDDGEEHYRLSPESGWSPDSRYLAVLREDWRGVNDLWLVNPLSDPRPTLETYKWPMPGEDVEQYWLFIYDSVTAKSIAVDGGRWPDQTIAQLKWSPDSSRLYFTRMSRDWMSLDLCGADPATGKCETLIEDRGHRQIITRPPYHLIAATGEILWWSMKNGWGHFYLHSHEGTLNARVTRGAFHSGRVVHIDEAERVLYFMGCGREEGRNPYFHHLYRVGLDGGGLELLTPEDAEHEISMCESGRFFLDNFSRADLAPRAVVRDSNGRLAVELDAAPISSLVDAGWKAPEIFKAKAADGVTDLWGVLFKPFDFDPKRKYPIVSYGYPGKEGEVIPWRFYHNSWVTLMSVSLAQYGFIVAVYGNRGGSPERGYDYYDFGADDLRDYPVADKKRVIEELAARHDYIDIDRVGIMGASSGGFMAAAAILVEPDFFKVAVSRAGNHDNNLYWHHWNERYGRVTEEAGDGGRKRFLSQTPTNNEVAANLEGRLLLVQGDMDLHVPPALTARLVNDLIEANKRFDQFIVPGCDHFFGKNWQYLLRYMELYFVENLMGDRSGWSADIMKSRSR